MNVTLGYINIEGLKSSKLQACCSLLDAGLFDILFLSETWFPKNFNYMSHPYSFIHTPYSKFNDKSRQSGGLLALVSPQIRSSIQSYQLTPYGILLNIDGTNILAVYIPPSLSQHEITSLLTSFSNYSILFGDINVRFKGVSRSNPSPHSLQDFWYSWLANHSLQMAVPCSKSLIFTEHHSHIFKSSHSSLLSSQFSPTVGQSFQLFPNCELDHLFHSNSIVPDVQLLGSTQFNLKTVHKYFIRATIPLGITFESELHEGLGRFCLEKLEKPEITDLLAKTWSKLDSKLDWNIMDVDTYNTVLIHSVQAVAEEVLGTYDVFEQRKAPDKVQSFLHSQLSATAAIRLFKRKQRNANPSLMITPEDPCQTAMKECIDKFESTFWTNTSQYQLPTLSSPSEADQTFLCRLLNSVSSSKVSKFIKDYPKDKACGVDSIHTVLLNALRSTTFFPRLSGLFSLCIKSYQTPTCWNQSVIYLLPKKNDPPITCNSVRPLSILPMFRRIFESLLLPIFTDPNASYTRLHPAQAGFRKGYSTLTHAAICHHAISTKAVPYAIFLDFKAAYDVTSVHHVMKSLQRRNLPVHLQYLVHSLMFQNGSFQLVVNGQLSRRIQRDCGLFQGSPLSPVIFDMFIDSLIYKLNYDHSVRIPSCLFFADDGLLLPKSKADASQQLAIADSWAKQNGMKYNVLKCGMICIDNSPLVGENAFVLDGKKIPIVDSYKYLGFSITKTGIDFKQHIQSQIISSTAFLKFVQIQCAEWSPYTRYIIYSTFLRPKLEYGAPLTYGFKEFSKSKTLLNPIQELQDTAIAWIFNCSSNKIKVLEGILGALTVEQRFSHLRCSFQLHLDHSNIHNPIRSLVQSSQQCQFLYFFRSNKLYKEFQSEDLPTHYAALKKCMAKFLLSRQSGILLQSKSTLINYIPFTARSDSLIDKVLHSPIQFQRTFLSWRRGSLFLNSICICKGRWHRGHIPCLPIPQFSLQNRVDFDKIKEEYSKNFCEVDYLLNVQEWDLAWNILMDWTNLLNPKL